MTELENKLEDIEEETPEASAVMGTPKSSANDEPTTSEDPAMDASFMSESIYQKIPSPKSLKHKSKSTPLQSVSIGLLANPFRETVYACFTRALQSRVHD